MAKPTTKTQAKNQSKSHAKPGASAAAKKTPTSAPATTRAKTVVAALAPTWPTLDKATTAAFTKKYTDAKCDTAGGKTKSEGVLGDAITWAPIMAKSLKAEPTALKRYSPDRFSWFLTCIGALADARALQLTAGAPAVTAKKALEQALTAASAARRELVDTLEEVCDGSDDEEAALSAALGTAENADALAASIASLAAYARGWLDRRDEDARALVRAAGLDVAEVEAAEGAGEALVAAAADKTMEGRVVPTDAPPVNRAEGRVLYEMKAALRVWAKANAKNTSIPRLVPGKATQSFLQPRASKHAAPPAPPPPPPAPAGPPAGGDAPAA